MEILKGSEKYLTDCVNALKDSELGKRYFSKEGNAEHAVIEGLEMGTLYVAVEKDVLKGFFFYLPNGSYHSFPYLHLIVTAKNCRGTGVGTQMLHSFETLANRPKVFLCVSDFNPDAKRFYERNGYVEVGRIDGLYRDGIREDVMMKIC